MSEPGKAPGPVRVKPNKRSDLTTDYRRAKLLSRNRVIRERILNGDWYPKHSDR